MLYQLENKIPNIHSSVFIAPSADIIGDVTINKNSSIWFNCTIRGDGFPITIGEETNIQDNTVIHIQTSKKETRIGNRVTVGHNAIIHAATIHDYAFIGMGSIILDGAIVRPYGFVAAGALVPPGFEVPEKTLVIGSPAKVLRPLKDSEIIMIEDSAKRYMENAHRFQKSLMKID